jgi:hypothetical protein
MNAQEIVAKAHGHITEMGKISSDGVTSITRKNDGWTLSIEVLERKAIPDTMDILGLYEITMNNEGELLSLERKKLRKRGDTEEH